MRLTQKLTPWLIGLAVASLLFALLFAFAGFHYSGNDDYPIMRSFMGYEGGVPARYNLYTHTAFAWILYGLALAFPGVAWFSVLQLFLLWFSCVVIVKSMAQSARLNGFPLWAGALAGSLFLTVFAVFILCRISYTTTGALVGTAAVAQLMGVDYKRGSNGGILRGMLLSITLLMCCYCLRQIGVLPPLVFWLLGVALIYVTYFIPRAVEHPKPETRRSPKPILIACLICALCFGVLAGIRVIEIKALDLDDYLKWQNARIQLFDYTNFYENTDAETLQKVGWSQAEFKLVSHWFFMDANITTEAFETLYAAQKASAPANSIGSSIQTIAGFFADNPAYVYACWLLLLLGLLSILPPLFHRDQSRWCSLAVSIALLCAVGLLLFLAYQGRLPMRAAVSVIFPAAAFLFCVFLWIPQLAKPHTGLLSEQKKPKGNVQHNARLTINDAIVMTASQYQLYDNEEHKQSREGLQSPRSVNPQLPWFRITILLACAACVALAAVSIAHTLPLLSPPIDPEALDRIETVPGNLYEFAIENPDMLIIYDSSLGAENRMFPDISGGIPPNTMFWGGWPAHSPSWLYQLAQYGIDGRNMTALDFMRENVLIAGTDGEPWVSLIAHIQENTDEDVEWDFYDVNGYVGFFDIYEY